jgi:two-component system OmpR family sensor kinase
VTQPGITEIAEPIDQRATVAPLSRNLRDLRPNPGTRGRFLPSTLTGRLVMGVVTLVIVLVAITGTTTYLALKFFLVQRLDQQLDGIANVTTLNVLNATRGQSSSPVVKSPQDVWLAELDSSGAIIGTVTEDTALKQMKLASADRLDLVRHLGRPRTITTTDGMQLRVQAFPVHFRIDEPSGPVTIQGIAVVGLSTHDVRATLRQLVVLELAVGAGAVAFAAGLTTWGVRRGLRPLHRVTRTAQEVTAELGPDGAGLDRRVPDADPTTEVGQVASSMNTLLGAVETEFAARVRSEDRMRQFLADASHELRTPLTSIRGYAELSRLQGESTNSPEDPMRRIEVEGTRMSRLVEDLLVLARGDQGTMPQSEPVDIDSLLSEATSEAHSAHPERDFSLVRSGGTIVIGDRDQLLRLMLNLLNNAAVHTPPNGPIRVEGIQGRTPDGPAVAVRVIDAGPGLPPDEAAHVFERFWRADKARTRAKGGSGLGMAIVAQIAEAHGGSVSFDSSVDSGTTVTVTLPMSAASAGRSTGQ